MVLVEVRTDEGLTGIGERLGTVDYMAPEQCRGERVGPAADIYSLGCVLYEALTGRPPYPAASEAARIAAHLHDPPPSASERWPAVPAALDAVIIRALDKEAGGRFASADELALAARRALGLEEAEDARQPASRLPGSGERPTIVSG